MTQKISPVQLSDVVDEDDLAKAITEKLVRLQTHPSEPLAILNYTDQCAYTAAWNPTTLACRGLIFHTDTLEVVARGFDKFFNYGQRGAPVLDLDSYVLVTDKKDGSLGIIYPVPSGGYAVATRGSFASEQALHATKVLNERYSSYTPHPGITTLVEIVYPANRVVLDYGDLDDLILIGGRALTGLSPFVPVAMQALTGWPGPVTETIMSGSSATFANALALPPRPNAEGVVVIDGSGSMIKIKQADYVELHRIVTNLTARKVHDFLLTGRSISEFIAPLPDEFHTWVLQVAEDITSFVLAEEERLKVAFDDVINQMPAGWSAELLPGDREARATYAKVAARHLDSWALFALLDGRSVRGELLKRARPGAFITPTGRTYTEDNA